MKKTPHCKKCDQDGHYSVNCHNWIGANTVRIYKDTVFNKPKNIIKLKNPSRSKLKKQLDKLVKDFVKERDNYTCQHCLKKVSGVSCQASHVFSVGSCPQLQFEPLNIKVLCAYCHLRWWHSSPIEATEWFNDKFPERLLELELLKRTTTKISTYDLQVLIDEYKQKLKDF